MTVLESTISQQIRTHIRNLGGYSIKLHSSAMQGAGEPDILACLHGQTLAVETKRPGEHPRPIQQYRLACWRTAGAITIVASSLEEFTIRLEEARGY